MQNTEYTLFAQEEWQKLNLVTMISTIPLPPQRDFREKGELFYFLYSPLGATSIDYGKAEFRNSLKIW